MSSFTEKLRKYEQMDKEYFKGTFYEYKKDKQRDLRLVCLSVWVKTRKNICFSVSIKGCKIDIKNCQCNKIRNKTHV